MGSRGRLARSFDYRQRQRARAGHTKKSTKYFRALRCTQTYPCATLSKRRDGIQRRARSPGHCKRGCGQQKLPTIPFRRRFADRFQIAVIKYVNAKCHQDELVNWQVHAFYPRRHDVAGRVASENGYTTFLQPARTRGVESGGMSRDVPGTDRRSTSPPACADKDHVAARDLDARLFLPRLEVLHVDWCLRFQIRHAL